MGRSRTSRSSACLDEYARADVGLVDHIGTDINVYWFSRGRSIKLHILLSYLRIPTRIFWICPIMGTSPLAAALSSRCFSLAFHQLLMAKQASKVLLSNRKTEYRRCVFPRNSG